jgi:hypothetical protein
LRVWYSVEIQTEVQLEVILVKNRLIQCLIFATFEGVKLLPEFLNQSSIYGT